MKKVVRVFILFTFVVYSAISFLYTPVNATIVRLTDDGYNYSSPQINNAGSLVSKGDDATDSEIFFYCDNNTIQLTRNDYDDVHPEINNAGNALWYGPEDGADQEIFLSEPFPDGGCCIEMATYKLQTGYSACRRSAEE